MREVAGREGERIGFGEFDRERGAALNPKVRVGFWVSNGIMVNDIRDLGDVELFLLMMFWKSDLKSIDFGIFFCVIERGEGRTIVC